jgi:serine/threonine protein kinase
MDRLISIDPKDLKDDSKEEKKKKKEANCHEKIWRAGGHPDDIQTWLKVDVLQFEYEREMLAEAHAHQVIEAIVDDTDQTDPILVGLYGISKGEEKKLLVYERMETSLETFMTEGKHLELSMRVLTRMVFDMALAVKTLHDKNFIVNFSAHQCFLKSTEYLRPDKRDKLIKIRSLTMGKQEGEAASKEEDLFHLGMVCFELLGGKKFTALPETDQELMLKGYHEGQEIKKLSQIAPKFFGPVSEELVFCIVNLCFTKTFKNIEKFLEAATAALLSAQFSYMQIQPSAVNLGGKLAKFGGDQGDSEVYKGTYFEEKEGKKKDVAVKQFFPAAVLEYLRERDTTILIHQKPGCKEHFVPIVGFCDQKKWIVTELMNGSLDQVYLDVRNSRKKDILTKVSRAWIMFDILRAIVHLHKPVENFQNHTHAVILHRDLKSANIFMRQEWEKIIRDVSNVEKVDELPVVAFLGDAGMARSASCDPKLSGAVGDPNYMPPEFSVCKYGPPFDVWRLGLVIFEIFTGVLWTEGTLVDQCRITRHRLKPQVDGLLTEAYTKCWMGSGDTETSVPYIPYEITQLGCWQSDPTKRPTAEMVLKMMRHHLEDCLIETKQMKPRQDPILVKPNDAYTDKVAEKVGWVIPSPPAVPKKAEYCLCNTKGVEPKYAQYETIKASKKRGVCAYRRLFDMERVRLRLLCREKELALKKGQSTQEIDQKLAQLEDELSRVDCLDNYASTQELSRDISQNPKRDRRVFMFKPQHTTEIIPRLEYTQQEILCGHLPKNHEYANVTCVFMYSLHTKGGVRLEKVSSFPTIQWEYVQFYQPQTPAEFQSTCEAATPLQDFHGHLLQKDKDPLRYIKTGP